MIGWILLIALVLVYSISLPPLLKRAGLNSALGYIPLFNFLPMLKMIKRPWYWFFVVLCPGINLFLLIILNVELGIAFGKRSTKEQWMFGYSYDFIYNGLSRSGTMGSHELMLTYDMNGKRVTYTSPRYF